MISLTVRAEREVVTYMREPTPAENQDPSPNGPELVHIDRREFEALITACKDLHLAACFGGVRHQHLCEEQRIISRSLAPNCTCHAASLEKAINAVCQSYHDIKPV